MQLENVGFAGVRLIEAYGDNGFRFSDGRHEGSVLILPERIKAFTATSMEQVDLESLELVIAQQAEIEILILGTGQRQQFPTLELRKYFIKQHIALEEQSSHRSLQQGTTRAGKTVNPMPQCIN